MPTPPSEGNTPNTPQTKTTVYPNFTNFCQNLRYLSDIEETKVCTENDSGFIFTSANINLSGLCINQ